MAMNENEALQVDTVLTTVALGVKTPELVGVNLFPFVDKGWADNKLVNFGADDFRIFDTRRAPGAAIQALDVTYSTDTISFYQDAMKACVPRERAEQGAEILGFDLQAQHAAKVMSQMLRNLEQEQAGLATNLANYSAENQITLSGTQQFNDYVNSVPGQVVEKGREAIRKRIGVYPNTIEIPATVYSYLKQHPEIKDQFKYTNSGSLTEVMLANYFNVDKVVIGKAIYTKDDGTTGDTWGRDIILAYVPQTLTSSEEPSYGYTFRLKGSPIVRPYTFNTQNESYESNVIYDRRPYITSSDAGYIIKDAVAA